MCLNGEFLKRRFLFIVFLGISSSAFSYDEVAAYQTRLKSLPYMERFQYLSETLLATKNGSVAKLAVQELLNVARWTSANRDGEEVLANCLDTWPATFKGCFYASLAQATMLHRMGKTDLAMAQFEEQIAAAPEGAARREANEKYLSSLLENDMPSYAVERYNAAVRDTSGATYAERSDLLALFKVDNLWAKRKRRVASFSAVDSILPRLAPKHGAPSAQLLAESVCLLIDERYDEALEVLKSVRFPRALLDSDSTDRAVFRHNERYNLPLYAAAIHLFEGENLEAARKSLAEFSALNAFRPLYVAQRLMRISSALERSAQASAYPSMLTVTTFLVENGFTLNGRLSQAIPFAYRLHMLDVHAGANVRAQNFEDAAAVCTEVIKLYKGSSRDAQSTWGLAEAAYSNSVFLLGLVHVRSENGDLTKAKRLFTELVGSASGKWSRVGKCELAKVYMKLDAPADKVRSLIEEVVAFGSLIEREIYGYNRAMWELRRYESH